MKIEITYEHNHDADYPCCARTIYNRITMFGIGRTWGNAADNLMSKIQATIDAGEPPKPIEIEI